MRTARRIPVSICSISLAAIMLSAGLTAQGGGGQSGARRPGGAEQIASIEERTNGLKKIDGFFPLYWDEAGGTLWLEIPKLDTEVLYSTGLGTGLGSNDIGLDRGALTGSRIVKFERVGPRVLMVQPNYQFRALTDERRGSADGPRRVRALGALGLPDRRRDAAAACSSTSPTSWCATPTTWRAGCARLVPLRRDAQLGLHADDARRSRRTPRWKPS